MRKIILYLIGITLTCFINLSVKAVEVNLEGTGQASITGYDVNSVRSEQNNNMYNASNSANYQWTQNKTFEKAVKQGNTRKKQDSQLQGIVRQTVVSDAQKDALTNALKILIDRTLGANSSNNPQVMDKFNDLLSQSNIYIISQNYSGEVKDNQYIAKGSFIIDGTAFRGLLKDLGIAINTQQIRASKILVLTDEFFIPPSDLNTVVPTKDVTTYKYSKDEKFKEKEAMKYGSSTSGGMVAASPYVAVGSAYKDKTAMKYGYSQDYSNKENEFYQHLVEYQTKAPKVENNLTEKSLSGKFNDYDITVINNDIIRSKYFKNNPITIDKLKKSEELAKYIDYARKEASADFLAIGTSSIIDKGIDSNLGLNVCDGIVEISVYSTSNGEQIASGSRTSSATGNSADQARDLVAEKIGNELGDILSVKIQDYQKNRAEYGSEFLVQVKGVFSPMERITLNKILKGVNGIQNVNLRTSDSGQCEYVINYKGTEILSDSIFEALAESSLAYKFANYDFKTVAGKIVFSPLKTAPQTNIVPIKNIHSGAKK